jgi:GTP pyrophosphokinase
MSIAGLIQKVMNDNPDCDPQFLTEAYDFALAAYQDKEEESGVPLIRHALGTALYLTSLHPDPQAIAAALLHDVLLETEITPARLRKRFGEEVAQLVNSMTRLRRISWGSLEKENTQRLRRMFLAMVDDVRVVLILLSEQLNSLHFLQYLPAATRRERAREALEIFAPLANRLGIRTLKWELEDQALQHLHPSKYREIVDYLAESRDSRELYVRTVITAVKKALSAAGIPAEISGRTKHIYSIYKKMKGTHRDFHEIHDVLGVRLIVPAIKDCYAALDIIHGIWTPIPGEYDDYIAVPKTNRYQSLHTAVKGPQGRSVEIQIRTEKMHRTAELGIAAHWRYKDKESRDIAVDAKVSFLRGLQDWQAHVFAPEEDGKGGPASRLANQVYALTPKGDIKVLPEGATPLDFAYHIHTDVGHRCRGAKVNGKLVTLDHRLQSGDRVEIVTGKQRRPSRDWLQARRGYVTTSRAKRDIRNWFQKQEREEYIVRGREALDRTLKRLGIRRKEYDKVAGLFGYLEMDPFFEAVGRNQISPDHIKTRLRQGGDSKTDERDRRESVNTPPALPRVTVRGVSDLLSRVARCCQPLPGDEIVGFITRGRGLTIHRSDCHNVLRQQDSGRLMEVDWGKTAAASSIPIQVTGVESEKTLKTIAQIIEDEKAVLSRSGLSPGRSGQQSTAVLNIEIRSAAQLNRILNKIKRLPAVENAQRLLG